MLERRNRLGIYLFGGLCLVACLVYLVLAGGPRILISIFVAAAATNGIALVINQLGYKLSVHSGTMAAIAFVFTLSLPWGILVTVLMAVDCKPTDALDSGDCSLFNVPVSQPDSCKFMSSRNLKGIPGHAACVRSPRQSIWPI